MESQLREKTGESKVWIKSHLNKRFVLPGFLIVLTVTGLVVLIAFVTGVLPFQSPPKRSGSVPVSSTEIEQRWGIRVTQVGVTADGGLVDFRYIVLDPDKALAMIQEEKNLPVLVPEDRPGIVNSAAMMPAKHNLNAGQTYFLLYRNTQGIIKPHAQISVVFGDVRLEHITVL
ncbi:MAG: hypothetical protein J0I20_35160 [Chloroflexi bacterium]|nr:hypothetical protein [Chloroflexota bacterium]OJV88905.1 MAG: hypothetical protein BGO39_02690 [Chloroflexi bacterium 54-19]